MKYKGVILTIITAIGLTFVLFNSIFQTFEFFVRYQLVAFMLFITALVCSIIYSIIENMDGEGW
ncbi:MAG: hypothetical protein AABX54_00355 [Nanoarchaeota archaeon]